MNDDQLLRYSRHILLPEIGVEGQQAFIDARVLVIGAGGLGSPAAMYLASAGVGTLVLVDDDDVDLTNLQRQILHTAHMVGEPKVRSGEVTLGRLNPEVKVVPLQVRLSGEALMREVAAADVVLDCCDNFETRHAVNRACHAQRSPARRSVSMASSTFSTTAAATARAITACFRKARTLKRCAVR